MLPRGASLDDESWRSRHHVLVAVLMLHVPVLFGVGIANGHGAAFVGAELSPIVLLVALGLAPFGRVTRSLAVTWGMLASSMVLVHLTGGLIEAHLHFFLAIALISIYRDWRPYVAAVGLVVLHHGVVVTLLPEAYVDSVAALASPARWAVIHGGFVVAVALTHLLFWKITEREQARARELWQQLYEGERGLVERLQSAEALKSELIAVVSHEFRTPLTAIIGFSHTLVARAEDLDAATIRLCVRNIDQQSRHLARLVHNVLAAAGDVAADPAAVTDLSAVTHDVAREIGDLYEDRSPLIVRMPPTLRASIDNDAAYRILVNLVDNAVKFSEPGSPVELDGRVEGCRAVVELRNEANPIAETQTERIFAPFVQVDSSDSRSVNGMGLGLHVARRLAAAHGGAITQRHEEGRVVFSAELPLALRPAIRPDEGGAVEAGVAGQR